ncbi:hypothetical protein GCM10009753_65280 [Streptantibioticus ferralitis]
MRRLRTRHVRFQPHLMPSGESRTRKAVDGTHQGAGEGQDGPETAQAAWQGPPPAEKPLVGAHLCRSLA